MPLACLQAVHTYRTSTWPTPSKSDPGSNRTDHTFSLHLYCVYETVTPVVYVRTACLLSEYDAAAVYPYSSTAFCVLVLYARGGCKACKNARHEAGLAFAFCLIRRAGVLLLGMLVCWFGLFLYRACFASKAAHFYEQHCYVVFVRIHALGVRRVYSSSQYEQIQLYKQEYPTRPARQCSHMNPTAPSIPNTSALRQLLPCTQCNSTLRRYEYLRTRMQMI